MMTPSQKLHLERIGGLADAISIVTKSANTTETESIKTLAEFVNEEIEKIEEEDGK